MACIHLWRRRKVQRQEDRQNIQQNAMLHLYDSERRIKDLIGSDQFREDDKKGIDVPYFDLKSILAATNNFSKENKLGEEGFESVYKGTLRGGQEIYVKRICQSSGRPLEEINNEVVLIAKLQHQNLIRLLGYCVDKDAVILILEYMPNRSLDYFIFDRRQCAVLHWGLRFNIILGVARGLLYLHRDSKLKIVHRDLQTSNILLDEEMSPKISNFGLAIIFGPKRNETDSERIAGNIGYMAPEYAMRGQLSVKADVFSFGVVMLEIISGL